MRHLRSRPLGSLLGSHDRPGHEQPGDSTRRRPLGLTLTVAALATVLAVGPWLPDSEDPPPAAEQSSGAASAASISPADGAEIDRVVAEGAAGAGGRAAGRTAAGATTLQRAAQVARCAEFDGQRYCLGVGFTTRSEDQVAADLAADAGTASRRSTGATETTGDLDAAALLAQRASRSPAEQRRLDRAELTDAALAADKIAELSGTTGVQSRTSSARAASYPVQDTVMNTKQVRSQSRYYWCGPAAMQMIAWGWQGEPRKQGKWARRLGTTTSGTAITSMVSTVNRYTGWDRADRAGKYITLDIGGYRFAKWYDLIKRHIHDYRAPVVLHPILLKRYFPYLDDDASGHFQAGRGYDRNPGGTAKIGYFEPWDQSRFDPSEPRIARVQWRSAYKSFRANKAHFQHNIGV